MGQQTLLTKCKLMLHVFVAWLLSNNLLNNAQAKLITHPDQELQFELLKDEPVAVMLKLSLG